MPSAWPGKTPKASPPKPRKPSEVGSEHYAVVVSALRGISRKLAGLSSKNAVIVTMRIQFFQQTRMHLTGQYVKTLHVRPFLPNEIYLFLKRWPFKHDKDRYIDNIYAELTDRPTLREMCRNPLVLAMYVESFLESAAGELPNTRTEFYERVVNELLVIRRSRQDVVNRATSALRKQRETILGRLAFQNLIDPEQPVNLLSWESAIAVAEDLWQCPSSVAESRLNELASETGIISHERLGESFRFIHQTFCEFLAATECAKGRKDGWSYLLRTHKTFVSSREEQLQVRLLEVIPFALALLQPHQQPAALGEISHLNDRLMLGRCFLETQLYGEAEWADYVNAERDYLSTSRATGWDESQLRRLQLFSVVLRDARDWAVEIERKHAELKLDDIFSNIVGDNREVIAKVFATYARQDAAAAIRLADQLGVDMVVEHPAIIVDSCQEEPFLALALERANSEENEDWPRVLLEAALRFANVAHRLDSTPAKLSVPSADKKLSSLLWLCGIDRGSWYEAIAQRVVAGQTDSKQTFEADQAFSSCLSSAIRNRLICLLGFPLGLMTTCGLAAAILLSPTPSGWLLTIGSFILFVLQFIPSVMGFGFARYVRGIYRDIGNAWPFEEGEPEEIPGFSWLGRLLVPVILSKEISVLIGLITFRPDMKSGALAVIKRDGPVKGKKS